MNLEQIQDAIEARFPDAECDEKHGSYLYDVTGEDNAAVSALIKELDSEAISTRVTDGRHILEVDGEMLDALELDEEEEAEEEDDRWSRDADHVDGFDRDDLGESPDY